MNELFYYYGIIYIIDKIFALFKKRDVVDINVDIKIDRSNIQTDMQNTLTDIMKNTKSKGIWDKINTLISITNSLWILMGLYTSEQNLFIMLFIFGVGTPLISIIFFVLKIFKNFSPDSLFSGVNTNNLIPTEMQGRLRSITNALSVFQIGIGLFIAYHHFFV